MKVALLTNIVPPYRVPVYRELAATPGWRLRVFTNAASEFDRSWRVDTGGLDVVRVPSLAVPRGDRTLHLPFGLPPALLRFAPDLVLSVELGARSLAAAAHAAAARVPLALWIEMTPERLRQDAGPLRRRLHPLLLARADAVLVPGREGRRVARALGVEPARTFAVGNAHDSEGFAKRLASLDRDGAARDLRAGLGARAHIALVAGRLYPQKGVAALLEAWDLLSPGLRADWTLLFVGDGPEAGRLRRAADTHAPGEIVRLPALQPEELVEIYAASDLLVFPSLGDVWGFAVNEAMACGRPVLCSPWAGCAPELVVPGETGWLADPRDPQAFSAGLREALTCGRREALGAAARERVARFTPQAMAEGVRAALHSARSRAASR